MGRITDTLIKAAKFVFGIDLVEEALSEAAPGTTSTPSNTGAKPLSAPPARVPFNVATAIYTAHVEPNGADSTITISRNESPEVPANHDVISKFAAKLAFRGYPVQLDGNSIKVFDTVPTRNQIAGTLEDIPDIANAPQQIQAPLTQPGNKTIGAYLTGVSVEYTRTQVLQAVRGGRLHQALETAGFKGHERNAICNKVAKVVGKLNIISTQDLVRGLAEVKAFQDDPTNERRQSAATIAMNLIKNTGGREVQL